MDHIVNFTTCEKEAEGNISSHKTEVKVRTGVPGIMYLICAYDLADRGNDGVVFMFRGSLTEQECKESSNEYNEENWGGVAGSALILMGNKHHPSSVVIDGNESTYTLWSPNLGVVAGQVKISEFPPRAKG